MAKRATDTGQHLGVGRAVLRMVDEILLLG
jgi:hypothetical protein